MKYLHKTLLEDLMDLCERLDDHGVKEVREIIEKAKNSGGLVDFDQ